MCRVLKVVGVIVLVLSVVGVVFVWGMRTKSPRVLDAIRRMNKTVMNPDQMKTAGNVGAYASVVHHVGRRSGTPYETPVVVEATDDGFVIALPYGTRADWVKNVLASGAARITTEGEVHEVDRPEVVPIETMADHFTAQDHRTQRVFGVGEALRVRRTAS